MISLTLTGCHKEPVTIKGNIEIEIEAGKKQKIKLEKEIDEIKTGIIYPALYADLPAHYFKIISGKERYGILNPSHLVIIQSINQNETSGGLLVEYNDSLNNIRKKVLISKSGPTVIFGVYPVKTLELGTMPLTHFSSKNMHTAACCWLRLPGKSIPTKSA
jgi:hypothetical protein